VNDKPVEVCDITGRSLQCEDVDICELCELDGTTCSTPRRITTLPVASIHRGFQPECRRIPRTWLS